MATRRWIRFAAALALLAASPAWAQYSGPPDQALRSSRSDRSFRANGQQPKPPPAPAPLRDVPLLWPRLDAGAVFCRSRDDLIARSALESNGNPGALPPGCRLVQTATPVRIVSRIPPGSTEVRLTSGGETGWTDAYLPDRAPAGVPGN